MAKTSDIAESREEAVSLGLGRFRSDKPCVNGHVGMRYTLNRNCVTCAIKRATDYQIARAARYNAAKKARVDAANSALQDADVT